MALIQELSRLQRTHGYLREADLAELSERVGVPLHRIEEVASFYPHFRRSEPAAVQIDVCRDLPCFLNGGANLCQNTRKLIDNDSIELNEVSCLGRCERAPAATINDVPVGTLTAETLADLARRPDEMPGQPAGRRDWKIDIYPNPGTHYGVYSRCLDSTTAASDIIAELKAANLRGMGGAGFPTGLKWELVRKEEASPKYLICNADESEPGTFKDRVILAELSHLMLEGMCLGALVTGAERGWIYLRHEYEPEREILEDAIERARERGVLGDHFDVEIFVSPGGYILGEETALLEALEDRRGEPRNKPPYPGQKGLRGKPTLINNVETLAMVPAILERGAEWWNEQGIGDHSGLKFIGLSGHVERPGVFEIPMGTTVQQLIELAGGVSEGRDLKAFAPGGASSQFLPADAANVEIDFDSLADAGTMLGSAALVVVAEGTDMIEVAANVVRFFRNESCGKCVPCRVGTEKVVAMLDDILATGKGAEGLLALLPDLELTLAKTSICGLGQVALNPLTSVLKHWSEELEDHAG